jgi:hypothetical protein
MRQLGVQVLIAAILRPVIRADGMTPAGACREWPKLKIPDDRRGTERVSAEDCAHRAKGTNRKRTVPASDPGGCSRWRPPARRLSAAAGRYDRGVLRTAKRELLKRSLAWPHRSPGADAIQELRGANEDLPVRDGR